MYEKHKFSIHYIAKYKYYGIGWPFLSSLGYVKLSGIDISESTGKYFENGSLAYVAGGNYATMQLAFAVLYNYLLDGTKGIADPAVNLMMNNIDIHNIDEFPTITMLQ